MKTCLLWFALAAAAASADIPRAEHPRPDFRRDEWLCLNGRWEFRFDHDDRGLTESWQQPSISYDRSINVPFGWENRLSGTQHVGGKTNPRPDAYDQPRGRTAVPPDADEKIGWYRRQVVIPAGFRGKRVWLRFGAVDWSARVWVNGKEVGQHEGGYTPFEFDVTNLVEPGKPATVVVRAYDATDIELPVGKQAWWYLPTSGIWQTVWLEARPASYIDRLSLVPRNDGGEWSIDVTAHIQGSAAKLRARSSDASVEPREEVVSGSEVRTRLKVKQPKLWTPDTPHLYDVALELESNGGAVDTVHSYFGMRTIGRGRFGGAGYESILLNGKPIYLRGALDQSFNSEGAYTAPTDDFLRRDMELAKSLGLNFLRIHIKVDEPRRLYWADRIGVLIMEDMPNTYRDTPRGRKAWEPIMRGAIERDRNHPAIFSWCLFNETWGLGGLKTNVDTQNWVLSMWKQAKELDATRLVEDNSANKLDHVQTDINSFHFYLDNPPHARNFLSWVARQIFPGSPFSYVPGHKQDTAPVINSEYGAIGSSGGDRDVSWGFRSLTTQMRRHEKIQGYVYTELNDTEWEHNGLANYDRSVKETGYAAFVPGMDNRDLQGADFIGYEANPAIESKPGSEITVPVFVSHYSEIETKPSIRWWITGDDDLGRPVRTETASRPASWKSFRVTSQEPIRARLPGPRPFVGALALELVDSAGKRIAANFVNIVARNGSGPRVEVLGPRQVALRFDTSDFQQLAWKDADRNVVYPSKFFALGHGAVEYRLALPGFVLKAEPSRLELLAEVASKAQLERLDWPSRRMPNDYPQTDGKKHRGVLNVRLAGEQMAAFDLPDDPADARGVLSHQAAFHHGSYGFLLKQAVELGSKPAAADQARKGQVTIRFEVPEGPLGKGLAIYGERMGRYPFDPTLIIHTGRDLSQPVGWTSNDSAAVLENQTED